ncbi:MAG TPA: HD domain-containing phosphohydrolase [Solirubrobacteraceae bacterium]|nr:HD domain-containing phosphohydrolase [Solirubrobacteraceae bacterium]
MGVCDHAELHSGGARYVHETEELRLVVVCDSCGEELAEIERIEYCPHARRFVAHLAELTAFELGLSDSQVAQVRFAALVCGVARDQIGPEILNKRGQLSPDEWAEVRRQPELGAALLNGTSFDDIREWVLCCRERPDGRGYPRGLVGSQIPLEARILAVTDAYAAMTSDRAYRLARDHEDACHELLRCAGTQFDADSVRAFLRASARRNRHLESAAA